MPTSAPRAAAAGSRPVAPPPQLYFLVSAVFHYLGPAFAVLLFARVEVLGVAFLRIASAAAVFALWRRPWRAVAGLDREERRTLLAWGALLAVMNCCFYLAIDRLPLGTVAAVEFPPVILLAAAGARTLRNGLAVALAAAGAWLLTDVRLVGEPLGVALAFANAVLFAGYVVLGHRVARRGPTGGIDGLAAAMLVAAVLVTPLAGRAALPAFTDPAALAAGVGVGVSSSGGALRLRPAHHGAAPARQLRAAGVAAAGDRLRRRRARARPGTVAGRGGRRRAVVVAGVALHRAGPRLS